MANIKCRWRAEGCACPYSGEAKNKICSEFTPSFQAEGYFNCWDCEWQVLNVNEFEGDYKSYEFIADDGLRVGGREINIGSIAYLEIDGRVLINNTEEALRARKEARLENRKKFIKWANFPE